MDSINTINQSTAASNQDTTLTKVSAQDTDVLPSTCKDNIASDSIEGHAVAIDRIKNSNRGTGTEDFDEMGRNRNSDGDGQLVSRLGKLEKSVETLHNQSNSNKSELLVFKEKLKKVDSLEGSFHESSLVLSSVKTKANISLSVMAVLLVGTAGAYYALFDKVSKISSDVAVHNNRLNSVDDSIGKINQTLKKVDQKTDRLLFKDQYQPPQKVVLENIETGHYKSIQIQKEKAEEINVEDKKVAMIEAVKEGRFAVTSNTSELVKVINGGHFLDGYPPEEQKKIGTIVGKMKIKLNARILEPGSQHYATVDVASMKVGQMDTQKKRQQILAYYMPFETVAADRQALPSRETSE